MRVAECGGAGWNGRDAWPPKECRPCAELSARKGSAGELIRNGGDARESEAARVNEHNEQTILIYNIRHRQLFVQLFQRVQIKPNNWRQTE